MPNGHEDLLLLGYTFVGRFQNGIHKVISNETVAGVPCRIVKGPEGKRLLMPKSVTLKMGGIRYTAPNKKLYAKK